MIKYLIAIDRNGVIRGKWREGDPVPSGLIIGKGWTIKTEEEKEKEK